MPIETGNSIEDVEANKIFISTKTTLFKLSRTKLISDVLVGFVTLLDNIQKVRDSIYCSAIVYFKLNTNIYLFLKGDLYEKITKKNIYALSSILIVMRLISECIEENWEASEPTPVAKGRVPSSFGRVGYVKPFLPYHTVIPGTLSSTLVQNLFNHIRKIKSQEDIIEAMTIITNGSIQLSSENDYETHPYRSTLQEIDDYCSNIIRYLSAANWKDVFSILTNELGIFEVSSSNENETRVVPFIDYLGSLYITENSLSMVFQELWHFLSLVRNPLHQAVAFNFLSANMEYWINARGDELFKAISEGSSLSNEASSFFDYMYTTTESSPYRSVLYRFMSILACFTPSCFTAFLSTGIKRFTSNTKKLKLLTYLKNQLYSNNVGDNQIASIINVGIIATKVFKYDKESYIIKFYLSLVEEIELVFENLGGEISPSLILLYCSAFTTFSILSPDYVLDKLHKRLNNLNADAATVCYLSTSLRAISAIPQLFKFYLRCMSQNATALRALIRKHARLLLKTRAVGGTSSKRSLSTSNSETVSLPILMNVFYAFMPHPYSYFEGYNDKSDSVIINVADKDLEPIVACMVDIDKDVASSSIRYVEAYYDNLSSVDVNSVSLEVNNPVIPLYSAAGYFIKSLSDKILDMDMNDQRIVTILDIIESSFKARAFIAEHFGLRKKCHDDITKLEDLNRRQLIYSRFETASLVFMCSPEIEIYKVVRDALSHALIDGHLTSGSNSDRSSCPLLFNLEQYEELSSSSFFITGAAALQKHIQKTVLKLGIPTDGIMNAWENILCRFSVGADQSVYENTLVKERRNYAGMLGCLCEPILASDPETNSKVAELIPLIYKFLEDVVKLLNSPNMYITTAAKDILSNEFSACALPSVFKLTEQVVRSVIENGTKDDILRISDHYFSLLRSAAQRCAKEKIKMPYSILDTGTLVLTKLEEFADDIRIIKLKIRCARLVQELFICQNEIQCKALNSDKFMAIVVFVKWFEKSLFRNDADSNSVYTTFEKKFNELDYVYADLSLACIKAVAYISQNVVIEVPQTESEEDYLLAKSSKYGQIFSVLLKALECLEIGSSLSSSSKRSITGSSSFVAKTISTNTSDSYKDIVNNRPQFQRSGSLPKFIIASLTNLLSANPDVGLKFSLPIGYHRNDKIRADFLKVFAGIILQGASTRLNSHDEEKLQNLMNFLLENMNVCVHVCKDCPASEVNGLAGGLFNLYESQGKGLKLLKALVVQEIENTNRVVDLLRRNSVATRMLSLYAKKYGSKYLATTFDPIIEDLANYPDKYVFELNVDKVASQNKAVENVEKFMKVLSLFSKSLHNSCKIMPKSFKYICKTIYDSTAKIFPEFVIASVGSFLFLRFFCPAICAPEAEGLLKHPPKREVRRSLLLLAKVIQNMANGTLYSLKMPLLYERMDELTRTNEDIVSFMRESAMYDTSVLLDISPDVEFITDAESRKCKIEDKDMKFIHGYLYNHWDEIKASNIDNSKNNFDTVLHKTKSMESSSTTTSSNIGSEMSADGIFIFEKLQDLVEEIGQPKVGIPSQINNNLSNENISDEERKLNEFLEKHAIKDFGPSIDRQAFVEGISADGTVYLIVSWDIFDGAEGVGAEMILYRILKVLQGVKDKKFILLWDATGFSKKTNMPEEILFRFNTFCYPALLENCLGLYCFNVSSEFLSFLRMILDTQSLSCYINPYKLPFKFFSSFNEDEDIPSKPFGLCKQTTRIQRDIRIRYTDAFLFDQDVKKFVPVNISLGEGYLQIHITDPISIQCGDLIELVKPLDVYHAADIVRSYLSNKSGYSDEFSIALQSGKKILLRSPRYKDVVGAINSLVRRYSEHSSTASLNDNAVHSIEDIMSILVNLVYASICADDSDVRTAGFNLACAVQKVFSITTSKLVPPRDDLFVPKNNLRYLMTLSEELVASNPKMTHGIISSFFEAYQMATTTKKDLLLMYIAPWIPYIYSNVYLSDPKKGKRRTKNIIREFLKISFISKSHVGIFHEFIWKPLCETNELAVIIVDEIISAAYDRRSEGNDCEEVITILNNCPTHNHCQQIMNKVVNISSIPVDQEDTNVEAKALAHSESNWVEIIVLIKAVIVLSFDNLELCRAFCPQLCFIGLMLINDGPSDLREALQSLTVNSFHTFLNDPTLDSTTKSRLEIMSDKFAGKKAELNLGISLLDEASDIIHTPALINSIELYVEYYTEIITLAARDKKEEAKWKDILTSLTIEAAFKPGSVVRARAFLVMSSLCKHSNTESIMFRLLEFWQRATDATLVSDEISLDLSVCILESLSLLCNGLSSKLYWYGKLLWIGFACMQYPHRGLYTASIKLVATVLECMDKYGFFPNGEMVRVLTKERMAMGPYLDKIDEIESVRYSPEMFDNYLRANMLKGFHLQATRSITIECLARIMRIEVKNMKLYRQTHTTVERRDEVFPVLCLDLINLFISDNKLLQRYANILEDHAELIDCDYGIKLPKCIFEAFGGNDDFVYVSGFIEMSLYKYCANDELVLLKFLRWLNFNDSVQQKMLILAFMKDKFDQILENASSFPTIKSLQHYIKDVTTTPDFNEKQLAIYMKALMDPVERYGFKKVGTNIDVLTIPNAMNNEDTSEHTRLVKILLRNLIENYHDASS